MPKFFKSLFGQVVLALLVGVLLGLAVPEFAVKLKPLDPLLTLCARCVQLPAGAVAGLRAVAPARRAARKPLSKAPSMYPANP